MSRFVGQRYVSPLSVIIRLGFVLVALVLLLELSGAMTTVWELLAG